MTVSNGKVIAFSAVRSIENGNGVEHLENGDSETKKPSGTPMLMQVSMVTTVPRAMNTDEFEKAMEFINKSKDTIKKTFKKGKDFYDKHNISGAIKAVQGVGDIVGGIMKFLPDEEDPMVQNLADLESDVKALGEKLKDNFSEMKAFISEQSFFTNIISPTSVLTKHMRDCLKSPGDDAKENFQKAYKNTKPLKLQYDLKGYLQQKTTNPLKLSMDAEKAKTKATFEKWEDIISRVMAQFILLEAFASGLLAAKSETNLDRLLTSSGEIFASMDSWKEDYKKDQTYWEELKGFLDPYITKHTNLNNHQKVAEIKEKLDSYLTSDAFYLCIFNESKWNMQYTYFCNNEKDNLIGSWDTSNKGKCNCFIYRSRRANGLSDDDRQSLRTKVINCSSGKLRWPGTLQNIIKNQLIDEKHLPGNGFICLIETRSDPQIFWSNSPRPEWLYKGPGHTSPVLMDIDGGQRELSMIASFP